MKAAHTERQNLAKAWLR